MPNCFVDMSHPMYGYNTQDKDNKIIVAINEGNPSLCSLES